MKYLITGGCGFLGSNIAKQILLQKQKLIIYDNLSRLGSAENLIWLKNFGQFEFKQQDIRNSDEINQIIKNENIDVIFHLAGQVAMTTSIEDPRKDFEINTGGTLNVLEAVRNFSPSTIVIYSSTNKVYGDLEWAEYLETPTRYIPLGFENGFNEKITLEFHSPYGVSKGSADQYMLDYARIFGLNTVVFRHSSMYGGRQFSTFDQGWIGWFCQQALLTKNDLKHTFTISGNGKQVRDLLYADDMVNLYISAAENIDKIKGKPFNIGGGIVNSLSLLELFEYLELSLQIKLNYTQLDPRISDQKFFVADISKISKLLNWQPQINKFVGINKMLEWINKK